MKTAGVIAEYNPFHKGHKYQLDKIREETGADYIIVAMSGDFLQRGVPALTDKYRRTRMALSEGADLVLELPAVYATASAEFFAKGGVNLLAATGVVDVLCYGCETLQPALMKGLVSLLTEESPEYQEKLRGCLAAGDSFPTARARALRLLYTERFPSSCDHAYSDPSGKSADFSENYPPGRELEDFLASPNNILALEYEKALATLPHSIPHRPASHPILRVGSGYHSRELIPAIGSFAVSCDAATGSSAVSCDPAAGSSSVSCDPVADSSSVSCDPAAGSASDDCNSGTAYASATAIREALESCKSEGDIRSKLAGSVPSSVLSILCDAWEHQALLWEDDFSAALYTRLWACRESGYEAFADCSRDLSNKIQNRLDEFVSFTQFAGLLKSRDITYTRVCRALTHILLGITKDRVWLTPGYLRVLGFRDSAAGLLSAIKKEASVPLITKVSDASRILSEEAYAMLRKDIHCADLYRGIASIRCHRQLSNEFTQGLILL